MQVGSVELAVGFSPDSASRELLEAGFRRYGIILQQLFGVHTSMARQAGMLRVNVSVISGGSATPGIETDYSYNMDLSTDPAEQPATMQIAAQTAFGAIYALETLSQLFDSAGSTSTGLLCASSIVIATHHASNGVG